MAGAGKRRLPAGGSPAGVALPCGGAMPAGPWLWTSGQIPATCWPRWKTPTSAGPWGRANRPCCPGTGKCWMPWSSRRPGRPCHCGAGPGIPPHLFPFHPGETQAQESEERKTAPPPLRLPPPVRGGPAARRAGLWPRVRGASGEGPGRRSQRRAGPAPPDGLQPGPDGGRPAKIHAGLLRRPPYTTSRSWRAWSGALRGRAPGLPPVLRHRRRHS